MVQFYAMPSLLTTVCLTFMVSIAAYWLSLRIFPKLQLLDFPERYGLKRQRLPYPTGIIAVLIFLGLGLAILPLHQKEVGVLLGVALLGITCFIDDRKSLPPLLRLSIHILIAALLFSTGSRIYTMTNPFGGILKLDSIVMHTSLFGSLPLFSGLFTIGWLLLTINALNWFDGIPGQVNVIATIGFTMLGFLALLRTHEMNIAVLAFSLATIAAAGAIFDIAPAKMIIGDTGAMFFGLLLGLLGVYHGGKVATAFLALGIPLIDAVFVIIYRLLKGRSPFIGSHDHLHHRLLQHGWSERQIISFVALLGTTFGGVALLLNTLQKAVASVVLMVIVAGLHLWLMQKTRERKRVSSSTLSEQEPLARS